MDSITKEQAAILASLYQYATAGQLAVVIDMVCQDGHTPEEVAEAIRALGRMAGRELVVLTDAGGGS